MKKDIKKSKNLKNNEVLTNKVFHWIKLYLNKYIAVILFICLWELLSIIGFFDPDFISSPTTVIINFIYLIFQSSFIEDIFYTFARVSIGIGLALLISIPLGFILGGFFKKIENSLNPMFRILEQFNPLTLFHLLILITLINELSTILVIYWAAQWPLLNNTISGAKSVNPTYIKIAKAATYNKFDIFWKIQLRSSLPNIFTGLRLSILFGFLIAFGVEMMGMTTGRGLGYFIITSQMHGSIPHVWVGIVTMTLLSLAMTIGLNKIEQHVT
ncbi:ABC transporter permease [Methanobrevibacter filiformis]|uniref:Bicarbonate transport system permease protein CmpB n=1 Tax=Methanobrevibacter filiformis TaxID=55758 RepID=A0A166C296_9EURY|nr:ABC transporter permease subunit [Methanobrevibacter filiformis]KZX10777.1 bicarbonate transport system permease protein CmpB [Methanobrevibacter filiformis]